jgi:uncharacterized protein (DUF1330 family)
MADLIASDSSVRPTTAIRRILSTPNDADLRRLQVKWKESGQDLLAQARARRDARIEADRRQRRIAFEQRLKASQDRIAESISAITGGYSAFRAARDLYDNPAMKTARDLYNSPALKAARDLYDSPAMRTARDLYDNPAMKAARDLYESPAMRAAREFENSATMQVYRELMRRRLEDL